MLLYESARLVHGRPRPLQGEFYDNLMVAFRWALFICSTWEHQTYHVAGANSGRKTTTIWSLYFNVLPNCKQLECYAQLHSLVVSWIWCKKGILNFDSFMSTFRVYKTSNLEICIRRCFYSSCFLMLCLVFSSYNDLYKMRKDKCLKKVKKKKLQIFTPQLRKVARELSVFAVLSVSLRLQPYATQLWPKQK